MSTYLDDQYTTDAYNKQDIEDGWSYYSSHTQISFCYKYTCKNKYTVHRMQDPAIKGKCMVLTFHTDTFDVFSHFHQT